MAHGKESKRRQRKSRDAAYGAQKLRERWEARSKEVEVSYLGWLASLGPGKP